MKLEIVKEQMATGSGAALVTQYFDGELASSRWFDTADHFFFARVMGADMVIGDLVVRELRLTPFEETDEDER
jgi:hypothetical protein